MPLLEVNDLRTSFRTDDGVVKAVDGISFSVEKGKTLGIVGESGCGKSVTSLSIMGLNEKRSTVSTGEVLFRGDVDLTLRDEADIARLGIGRKFQKPTVFENLTVHGNLDLALAGRRDTGAALFGRETAAAKGRIEELLALIRLTGQRNLRAAYLSHGQKQWLEIGMLLAQEPQLLLVDEPVAGMTDAETRQTAELLKEINRDRTVVVVEHDMTFVRELGVKVTCLHEGSVLAEGTIDQVSTNERVVEVYLGR